MLQKYDEMGKNSFILWSFTFADKLDHKRHRVILLTQTWLCWILHELVGGFLSIFFSHNSYYFELSPWDKLIWILKLAMHFNSEATCVAAINTCLSK